MLRSVLTACSVNSRSLLFPQVWQFGTFLLRCRTSVVAGNVNKSEISKTPETFLVEDGIIKKFLKTVGWIDHTKARLKLSGYFLYECIVAKIEFTEWFQVCDIPDTFSSWFAVTELHVWMLMVRAMAEDVKKVGGGARYVKEGEGRYIRNCIVEALWADVGNRIKLLENVNRSIARKQVLELSEQFQAALISYDEGISDDRILAAAVWRRIFNMELVDAEHVEKVVKFIRQQMVELDNMTWESLVKQHKIQWLGIKNV